MKLAELLTSLVDFQVRGSTDIDVSGIAYNSKEVQPGWLFVAIPGLKADGRDFIPQASLQGAVAVVFEGEFFDKLRANQIRVSGARRSLARLASRFYAHPTQGFYLAGVTGTNGKTTITYLMEALWQEARFKTGIIGTVNYRYNTKTYSALQTTPESRDLQQFFSRMRDAGVQKVCMEVSSHGVSLSRVEACQFDSCTYTNLSRDHLDFHGTMEEYYRSKERLFIDHFKESSKKDKMAFVANDHSYGRRLAERLRKMKIKTMTYGLAKKADLHPSSLFLSLSGFEAVVKGAFGRIFLKSRLIGGFNVSNVLAAVGIALHSGLDIKTIEKGIENFGGVPGRLERIPDPSGRLIFVDYAHTPDALRNVLKTLKEGGRGRIITVFGCGGDRDKTKRPRMGFEVGRTSDVCIITSDNPRTEDPQEIINQILPGVKRAGARDYFVEVDRRRAILHALESAQKGDIVLIAGKGHEDYQIVGTTRHHFSDQEVAREIVGKCY